MSKLLIFKLPNASNKDTLSVRKRLLPSAINKCNKELQHVSKKLSQSETFLSKQLSNIDFYILNRSITSHNKKSLQKSLNTQHKKLSSLTRNCSLPTITSNETIINLTKYELSQEESDLLKADLYLKAHLSYLANSYFCIYKPSRRILCQHRVLQNIKNNEDILITKPDKENGVAILDRQLYDNAIQKIISGTSKFENLKAPSKDATLKREASLQRFLRKLKQKKLF